MRHSLAIFCPAVALFLIPPAAAQTAYPILKLDVIGNERLPAPALVEQSGVALGQQLSPDTFGEVCDKLQKTGLIEWCQYNYSPASSAGKIGIALTIDLREFKKTVPALVDIPGHPAESFWHDISGWNGLLQPQLPGNEMASDYYLEQFQKYLAETGSSIKLAVEVQGLTDDDITLLFQPLRSSSHFFDHLPREQQRKFASNR